MINNMHNGNNNTVLTNNAARKNQSSKIKHKDKSEKEAELPADDNEKKGKGNAHNIINIADIATAAPWVNDILFAGLNNLLQRGQRH